MDDGHRPPGPSDDPLYSYKPSLMGAAWEFRLRPDVLEWRMGRHEGPAARITAGGLSKRSLLGAQR